jgi:hypothetical protein
MPPPGRPVVSGNGRPTEKISKFVDHFLNPTVKDIWSYVKDTTHVLKLMEELEIYLTPVCWLHWM